MTLGLLFWILMLLWVLFGIFRAWPTGQPTPQALWPLGGDLLLFLLLLLLGWGTFGPPIR